MKKIKINYIVDLLMTLCFIIVSASGLILFLFLPGGIRRGGYQEFIGIIKQNWVVIHDWSGIILIILVLIHFLLHWNWITCMTKDFFSINKKKK